MTASRTALAECAAAAADCRRCGLAQGRLSVVFGEGPADARVMLIGEAPGRLEDETGRPFCGRSGALLDRLLSSAGIDRSEVYVTSIVKCRPPGNRNPARAEIEACSAWLDGQIKAVSPALVCTLGNFALRRLTGTGKGISEVHGIPQPFPGGPDGSVLMPLFHPAAALRSTGTRELLAKDLEAVAARIALLG